MTCIWRVVCRRYHRLIVGISPIIDWACYTKDVGLSTMKSYLIIFLRFEMIIESITKSELSIALYEYLRIILTTILEASLHKACMKSGSIGKCCMVHKCLILSRNMIWNKYISYARNCECMGKIHCIFTAYAQWSTDWYENVVSNIKNTGRVFIRKWKHKVVKSTWKLFERWKHEWNKLNKVVTCIAYQNLPSVCI